MEKDNSLPTKIKKNAARYIEIANTEYAAMVESTKGVVQHAMNVGDALFSARRGLLHGQWLSWLRDNCPEISERTAQRCMWLAHHRHEIEKQIIRHGVADLNLNLSMNKAIRLISAPKKPKAPPAEKVTTAGGESLDTSQLSAAAQEKIKTAMQGNSGDAEAEAEARKKENEAIEWSDIEAATEASADTPEKQAQRAAISLENMIDNYWPQVASFPAIKKRIRSYIIKKLGLKKAA
jgi:galactitol-specific phosphotransferase system IIB component